MVIHLGTSSYFILTYLRKQWENFTCLSTNAQMHSTHVFVTHSMLVRPLEHALRRSLLQSSYCSVATDIHQFFGETVPRNMLKVMLVKEYAGVFTY